MGRKEREIGKRAEREAAQKLNELLGTSFRRSQQYRGTAESADIIDEDWPNLYVEVKRRKAMNLHNVVEQSQQEAGPQAVSVVMHKQPGRGWLISLAVEDLPDLAHGIHQILNRK